MAYSCPICGYGALHDPPRAEGGGGSYEICPSCGFEFGVSDDDLGFTYEAWRERWVAAGMPWCDRGIQQPKKWDAQAQLVRLVNAKHEPDGKTRRMTMDIVWSRQVDEILAGGRYLEGIGVRNWGLEQQQALIALTRLGKERIAVLGGDVYQEVAGVISATFDSWHVDASAGEPNDLFIARSIATAKAYVCAYKSTDAKLFVIVPKMT